MGQNVCTRTEPKFTMIDSKWTNSGKIGPYQILDWKPCFLKFDKSDHFEMEKMYNLRLKL